MQIRKGRGAFGSNQVLLRHFDGELVNHENEFFFYLSDYETSIAKPFFKKSPSDEGDNPIYTINEREPEAGYLVDTVENMQCMYKEIKPVEIVREKGFFYHPNLPDWRESTPTDVINKWFQEHCLDRHVVMMDGDADKMFVDSWFEGDLDDCSPWNPTPPDEDAILLAIYDTEDGPCAWFGVPIPF
ncbi:hypothetical protein KCM76_22785 [Zooshikella marina]|uniref:hypothetical protein n=1 Tax=Zooshikella ganghwensis TaxID=202772 RepID=UPI001BB0374D|nr:hypothetical protein [Zooshikella ganghwensis]MBU2708838.1 hypothetical protein [Zooshikella ganghwensis]